MGNLLISHLSRDVDLWWYIVINFGLNNYQLFRFAYQISKSFFSSKWIEISESIFEYKKIFSVVCFYSSSSDSFYNFSSGLKKNCEKKFVKKKQGGKNVNFYFEPHFWNLNIEMEIQHQT